jgi:hypothetical protein
MCGDTCLQSQVNLIISLKRMLEESEIIMKFTNFLSNDTGESTKHFNLDASGFKTLPELENAVRELRDYLNKLWNEAPAKAKVIAAATASGTKTPTVERSVDLTNFGHRIQSLAEMCKDNNTDLESACISVQRSGVGFVNPRIRGARPQKMQQQGHEHPREHYTFPTQHPVHAPFQQQHQQHFAPQPLQYHMQPMLPDLSASTQAVMQLANIKMMQKLVDAINRLGNSGSQHSESSEYTTEEDDAESVEPDIPSEVSFRRPMSSASRSSSQRPSSAMSLKSVSRPSSALSLKSGPVIGRESSRVVDSSNAGADLDGGLHTAAAAQRPFSASSFIASDEARSRGARYMQ